MSSLLRAFIVYCLVIATTSSIHITCISTLSYTSSSAYIHRHQFVLPPASPYQLQIQCIPPSHPSPSITTCVPSPLIHHLLYCWSSANSSSAAQPPQSIPLPQYRTNTIRSIHTHHHLQLFGLNFSCVFYIALNSSN